MQLTWYGHSCFLLESDEKTRILTDPCSPDTGYDLHDIPADVVTVSHDHYDHNCIAAAAGDPVIVSDPGAHFVCGVSITGFPTWHDEVQGKKRGANILYRIELDGIRVLHLGDLGHVPDQALIDAIGPVDVLLCPIGGTFTIDAAQAVEVAHLFKPRVFIPMHYLTPRLAFSIAGLDELLRLVQTYSVHRLGDSACTLSTDTLGEKRVLILDYAD